MKITRMETWAVPVSLEMPYAVAYGRFDRTTLVFLRLETQTGLIGYGSAGCDEEVTGETDATVLSALTHIARPLLLGANAFDHLSLIGELRTALASQPSAMAAIDMAVFDLAGQRLRQPLWKLLGSARNRVLTSITIGILPLAETLNCAANWLRQGFRCLKLKGGHDVEADIERIIRLREHVGPEIGLRFDANQGYTVEDALRFAEATQAAKVEFLEQPTTAKSPALLGRVQRSFLIPVMADESLLGGGDASTLAGQHQIPLFNIKLMKTGGIVGALEVTSIASAHGAGIMVGCMDESALGIAAGLHFALGSPAVKYADLDGHIGLIGDPAAGQLRLADGFLYPPDGPGLGVVPRSG